LLSREGLRRRKASWVVQQPHETRQADEVGP
jgi:hypothetical protein